MLINDNGKYREATQEEIARMCAVEDDRQNIPKTTEERLVELEQALLLLLEGATE